MNDFLAHILVVDDDDGIRTLVKKYLNENKYLVTVADNAENASEKIKIIKFDLIILDIMMPGKSGLEFIKENKIFLLSEMSSSSHIYHSTKMYCSYHLILLDCQAFALRSVVVEIPEYWFIR